MRPHVLAYTVLLLLTVPLVRMVIRPTTPEEVAHLAITALERRDAGALYALGSPREFGRAGITRAGVVAYLGRTLYREGDPRPFRVMRVNTYRPNCVQYVVATGRLDARGHARTFIMTVQQFEGERFRVALGEMLWNLIAASYPSPDPDFTIRAYLRLSKETGIHGWLTVKDGWTLLPRSAASPDPARRRRGENP